MTIIQIRQLQGHITRIETEKVVDWNKVCKEAAHEIGKWFFDYVKDSFSSLKPGHYLCSWALQQLKVLWIQNKAGEASFYEKRYGIGLITARQTLGGYEIRSPLLISEFDWIIHFILAKHFVRAIDNSDFPEIDEPLMALLKYFDEVNKDPGGDWLFEPLHNDLIFLIDLLVQKEEFQVDLLRRPFAFGPNMANVFLPFAKDQKKFRHTVFRWLRSSQNDQTNEIRKGNAPRYKISGPNGVMCIISFMDHYAGCCILDCDYVAIEHSKKEVYLLTYEELKSQMPKQWVIYDEKQVAAPAIMPLYWNQFRERLQVHRIIGGNYDGGLPSNFITEVINFIKNKWTSAEEMFDLNHELIRIEKNN